MDIKNGILIVKKVYNPMEEKMAKVQYPATVLSFVGKIGSGVYYRSHGRGFGYVRQWVVPAPSEQNQYYGFKIYNLSRIWYFTSKQYKSDLRIYAPFWASLDYPVEFLKKRSSNPFSIFFHIFLKFEENFNINFLDFPLSLVIDEFSILPHTIKDTIDQGFLPIPDFDYSDLINNANWENNYNG